MDEKKYQLGIRQLSEEDKIKLITQYRNNVKSCIELCERFAEENLAQEPLHKIICAQFAANMRTEVNDFNWAIRNVE